MPDSMELGCESGASGLAVGSAMGMAGAGAAGNPVSDRRVLARGQKGADDPARSAAAGNPQRRAGRSQGSESLRHSVLADWIADGRYPGSWDQGIAASVAFARTKCTEPGLLLDFLTSGFVGVPARKKARRRMASKRWNTGRGDCGLDGRRGIASACRRGGVTILFI